MKTPHRRMATPIKPPQENLYWVGPLSYVAGIMTVILLDMFMRGF